MKLLIAGARGQVGAALVARCVAEAIDVIGLDRADLDVTDEGAVRAAVGRHRPDVVINAAAYTAVDRAEVEPDTVFCANRDGAHHLALACAENDIPLIHISTDYLFDGQKSGSYTESDPPNPLGVYGMSKWEGEEAVRSSWEKHVILRTSWVFSSTGSNFVRTMVRLARERDELRVVSDQHGSPTSADDIAECLLRIVRHLDKRGPVWGTYHFAGQPPATWFAFARAIVDEVSQRGLSRVERIVPITSDEYPTAAQRPLNSVLDTAKIESVFGITAPDWRDALSRTISEIVGN